MRKGSILLMAAMLVIVAVSPIQANEALIKAFENGETGAIIQMFKDNPEMMKADLGSGMISLHYAAYFGNEAVVDYVLEHGVGLHVKDQRGLTPVWFSVSGGRPAMLK